MIIRDELKTTSFYEKATTQHNSIIRSRLLLMSLVLIIMVGLGLSLVAVGVRYINLSSLVGACIVAVVTLILILVDVDNLKKGFDIYEIKVEEKKRVLQYSYLIKENGIVYYVNRQVFLCLEENQTYLFLGRGNKLYSVVKNL